MKYKIQVSQCDKDYKKFYLNNYERMYDTKNSWADCWDDYRYETYPSLKSTRLLFYKIKLLMRQDYPLTILNI